MDKKRIGLFGFGTVGKGLYEIIKQTPSLDAEVAKVCIKRLDLERIGHDLYFTDSADELLNDPEIDIIIEVIDDAEASKEIVFNALKNGKSVISANKKMIGESLTEINNWHHQFEHPLLYEAAVGGGIPIINTIDTSFQDYGITKIRGVLNGSSNYILTQMFDKGWSFDHALSVAQQKGFAETDPTLDVDGFDAGYKSIILAYHAFGQVVSPCSVAHQSIRWIAEANIIEAKSSNRKIKQVVTVNQRADGTIQCTVQPEWLGSSDELYAVDNENNVVSVQTSLSDTHFLVGKGAGALPTGSAVFSDLKRILKGYRYSTKLEGVWCRWQRESL